MKKEETKRLVTLSLFAAIVVVLQLIASYITIGGFPITLTLVPIVLAGAIYDEKASALLGFVFGLVVLVKVLTGQDIGGNAMFALHPLVTVFVCLFKGTMAGLVCGLLYKVIKNKKLAIFVSAASAPLVNTSILYLILIVFFDSTFTAFIAALMSVNFLIELLINVLLAPGLLRVIEMPRR